MDYAFIKGDVVYHKNLKLYGIYSDSDWASDDSCFVNFENDSTLCVSKNQLVKIESNSVKQSIKDKFK